MTGETSERHTDILNGLLNGESNYFHWARQTLGDIRLTDWEWGAASFRWVIEGPQVMPDGVMFGGHIASVADHVASVATMTVLSDVEDRFRTTRLETSYFRPIKAPFATIDARVTNASRRLIHVEADFYNAEEKLAVRVAAVEVRRHASDQPGG